MQPRLLINLSLVTIIVILAIALVLTGEKETEETDVPLTGLSIEQIDTVRILNDGEVKMEFARDNDRWMMQTPFTLPASPRRINTLLKLSGAHSYAQFDRAGMELTRFGLDQPRVSVIFNDTRIDLGENNPLDRSRYVMTGEQVHLINDSLYEQLQAGATFFLDTRLLPPDAGIEAIRLPDHTIRKTGDQWSIEPDTGIGPDEPRRLVEAWKNTAAITLQPYEGDGEPEGAIVIDLAGNGRIEFLIISAPPKLVLARPDHGIRYHISEYDSDRLFPQPGEEPDAANDTAIPALPSYE